MTRTSIIESVVRGGLEILQPVHWLAEVAAVAARLTPQTGVRDVEMLTALEFPTTDDPNVHHRVRSTWRTRDPAAGALVGRSGGGGCPPHPTDRGPRCRNAHRAGVSHDR